MGINICVYNEDLDKHPSWDWFRYANDKKFVRLIAELGERKYLSKNWYTDHTFGLFKFEHPEKVKDAIKDTGWANQERYLSFVDIICEDKWHGYISN